MEFPTQAQAQAHLEALRRRRDALDREIADCLAFLDLGHRLRPAASLPEPASDRAMAPDGFDAGDDASRSEARRRGRAIVAACVALLREAGRPLHAGELVAGLAAAGVTVPGPDPVAALNTRLWKRSNPGGPFRRLGDAVYDLA
ncbi:hypothetical protein ASG40_16260 [Methylobacterium sp. Leaf399]|uniref:hypothetical protein n=1 Tax=unclassified Methylobacterium TaxID=2615210 RepID=UPI0006FA3665|nr:MULTISPECIES: hypothetical protein [unclassified Methylobacterium]KQP49006.1 hypothetical protein ASF39_14785 [Methylobacterium sp. Leaf108]KQT18882.1 hypothetical protein ASG40_16260 [Methylobacterium sp. Leaf399]KQT86868.1 hypothetical protein ASG59_16685 [Methylobacterium sp. Leaf466]